MIGILLLLIAGCIAWGLARSLPNASGRAAQAPNCVVQGLHIEIYLVYRDANGRTTRRNVTIHELEGQRRQDGKINIHVMRGYCHLRKGARTFRMDRVISAADADGVVVNGLQAWLQERMAEMAARTGSA